jgi:hypothetical protein
VKILLEVSRRVDEMGDIGVVLQPKIIHTFDEVIRERGNDEDQNPLIAYPRSKQGITDYELFSGRQLDLLVDGAAKRLLEAGIEPLVRSTTLPNKVL